MADMPIPVTQLVLDRYYVDEKGTQIDPDKQKLNASITEPLKQFVGGISKFADSDDSDTALEWMVAWAKAGAYLGKIDGKQAEYQRKWDLCGICLAYYKVKDKATPAQKIIIEDWLNTYATRVINFFDPSKHKKNNQYYWVGLAALSAYIVLDKPRYFDKAVNIFLDSLNAINDDGSLPLELDRDDRALHYHCFACMPLMMMAAIREKLEPKSVSWWAPKITALAELSINGLNSPEKFMDIDQESDVEPGAGWYQLYRNKYPDSPETEVEIKDNHRWLGGKVDNWF